MPCDRRLTGQNGIKQGYDVILGVEPRFSQSLSRRLWPVRDTARPTLKDILRCSPRAVREELFCSRSIVMWEESYSGAGEPSGGARRLPCILDNRLSLTNSSGDVVLMRCRPCVNSLRIHDPARAVVEI